MPSSALLQLQHAARAQSLVDIKRVLSSLSAQEKAQCWAVPDVVLKVMETMGLEGQAMTWIPGLQLVEMLVEAGAPVPPLATAVDQPLSPLQVAVSPSWLPHDATTYPLKPGELTIAKRVLGLLASRSGTHVPSEGLTFDEWKGLDPWACLLACAPCHGLACDLVEAGVLQAWVDRPAGAKIFQWPLCPLAELASAMEIGFQARTWTVVLAQGHRLPPMINDEPALHYFCGLDLRPGAPALVGALNQGLDPRARNQEGESALEASVLMPAPSVEDWMALVSHDIRLLDEPSSDGRTVYAVVVEGLRTLDLAMVEDGAKVKAFGDQVRAHRRAQQLDEHLPAPKHPVAKERF